jgi:hypothetical protein
MIISTIVHRPGFGLIGGLGFGLILTHFEELIINPIGLPII